MLSKLLLILQKAAHSSIEIVGSWARKSTLAVASPEDTCFYDLDFSCSKSQLTLQSPLS